VSDRKGMQALKRRSAHRYSMGMLRPCVRLTAAQFRGRALSRRYGPPVKRHLALLCARWTDMCVTAKWSARLPLWVRSGHRHCVGPCPLYPQKRTLPREYPMSALCQKRTLLSLFDDRVTTALNMRPRTLEGDVSFHPKQLPARR
jgi:hypothetical protein